jgi:hypothetical protein
MNVSTLQNLCLEKINIKRPLTYPNDEMTIHDVYYKDSPILINIKGLKISMRNKSIKLMDTLQSLEELQKLIMNIINRVKNNKRYIEMFNKKEYYTMFDSSNIVHFKNICSYDTTAFNIDNEKIDLERMKKYDNVSVIVYLKNIWINDKYYGVNMKLSQIQRIEPLGIQRQIMCLKVNPSIPMPPPPPLKMKSEEKPENQIPKLKIVRPSLVDILNSRGKLRKTNLLS